MKLLSLALFCILALPCLSQETKKVSLRTLCFKRVGQTKEIFLLGGTEEKPVITALPLYISTYSNAQKVTISGKVMKFATRSMGPDGEPVYDVIAQGRTTTGDRQVAIFVPSGKTPDIYQVLILDEGEKAFPLGSTRVVNISPKETRITIGEQDRIIKPGTVEEIPMATQVNELNQATVRIFTPMEDKWRPISSVVWKMLPKLRNFAIAYQNPKTGRPSVNCYQEVPPWRLPGASDE